MPALYAVELVAIFSTTVGAVVDSSIPASAHAELRTSSFPYNLISDSAATAFSACNCESVFFSQLALAAYDALKQLKTMPMIVNEYMYFCTKPRIAHP